MISASRSIEPGQNVKSDFFEHISVKHYMEQDDDAKNIDDLGIFDNPSKMGTKVISTSPSTTLDPIIQKYRKSPTQYNHNSRKA